MDKSLSKNEKLKSKQVITTLFENGESVGAFPLKLLYIKHDFKDASPIKVGVSVSKRNFKKAVDRNRIKRLLRESYRLNKGLYFNNSTTSYAFMILYLGKVEVNYSVIETKMKILFQKFIDTTSNH